jgi:hypothetical protein
MAERFTMMKVEPGSVGSHADRGFQGRDEGPKEKKKKTTRPGMWLAGLTNMEWWDMCKTHLPVDGGGYSCGVAQVTSDRKARAKIMALW